MDNCSDEGEYVQPAVQPKKRTKKGKITDVARKIRAMSHISGEDCNCTRFQCFKNVIYSERQTIIKKFNLLGDKNSQDSYLSGLIALVPIKQRRPRGSEGNSLLRQSSYCYKVRVARNATIIDVPICQKAFISIHGITNQRISTIKTSLRTTGLPPKDGRGKHTNRAHKMKSETLAKVKTHIESLKGRRAHYSTVSNKSKLYLSDQLNVKKLHKLYTDLNPRNPVSYESCRSIFVRDYNISFGYPRSDTCSTCDQFQSDVSSLKLQLKKSNTTENKTSEINSKVKDLEVKNKLHKLKAETFYTRKRIAKQMARKSVESEALCFDFMKNLPVPNISTNDVYYRRQLSFYMFNVHVLSTGESFFFTYDETVAKKGADDVTSMLDQFFKIYLSSKVRNIQLFCDSCAGQNKNFTVIRYLHSLVHVFNRFDSVRVTFPVRGHSYMECDKNMGLIKQTVRIELPDQWNDHVQSSRCKPSPFTVIKCEQHIFKKWCAYLDKLYKKKSPFATRPISEISIAKENIRTLRLRTTYNGPWESYIIRDKIDTSFSDDHIKHLQSCYTSPLPVSLAKYEDLKVLKRFCGDEAQQFFERLPYSNNIPESDDLL